jgi:hypothetical protein
MINDVLSSSLKKLTKTLTADIRKDALIAGWPVALADSLSVKIERNSLSVEYPEDFSQKIEDLEYGDGMSTPRPVLRRFASKHKLKLKNDITEASADWLFEEGILP